MRRPVHLRQGRQEVSALPTVTTADFDERVLQSDKPVLVDFWAEWCSSCKAMFPVLEDLAVELGDELTVVSVDAAEQMDLTLRYNVRQIPTMLVFSGGQVIETLTGPRPKNALKDELRNTIGRDKL